MLYARTYYIHTFTEGRSKSSLHPLIWDVFPIIRTGKTYEFGRADFPTRIRRITFQIKVV